MLFGKKKLELGATFTAVIITMPMLTPPLLLTGLVALPGAARAFMAVGAGASLSPPHRHFSVVLQFDDGGYDAFAARPPSDKQIAFAQRLSLQTETSMPHEATVDAAACSQFIDTLLNQVPASEKQASPTHPSEHTRHTHPSHTHVSHARLTHPSHTPVSHTRFCFVSTCD